MKLYHGSPVVINDRSIAAGTYFTEDIEIAQCYGNIIYSYEANKKTIKAFKKDSVNEHWVLLTQLPIYLTEHT